MTRLSVVLVAVASVFVAPVTVAACGDLTRRDCRFERLQSADQAINATYSSLLTSLPSAEVESLRLAQRNWIKQRDIACQIEPRLTRQSDWLARLATDSTRAICVVGASEARLGELRDLRVQPMFNSSDLVDRREFMFPITRKRGKWYFEVEVVTAGLQNEAPFSLQIGIASPSQLHGMQADRKTMMDRAGSSRRYWVGMAVDLDNGKAYWSENGEWQQGEPGTAGGSDIKRGDDYAIRVISTGPSLSQRLQLGSIRLNTGTRAFTYPVPAGFVPFYADSTTSPSAPSPDWIVPRHLKVQGASYDDWAKAYWGWLYGRERNRNPVQDLTGQYCADGQSGPVWMLAGGDAAARIERSCRTPRGRYLLLPLVVQSASANKSPADCEKLIKSRMPQDAANAVDKAFVVLDGLRMEGLNDYRIYSTSCTTISSATGSPLASNAVIYGMWVMLRPLPPGDHVIRFGGELPALGLTREVTYRIRVE